MRKVTWGMIGTATIAKRNTIAGMKKAPNCRLYAVAGRNPEKVDQYVNEYGFEKGYYSYDELLDDPEIEAVYIPLPNSLHYEWVLKAVAKKKHVLCEKPMGLNAEQSEKMIAAAKRGNAKLGIGHIQRFGKGVMVIKEFIENGKLIDKRKVELPDTLKNVIKCKNPRCITTIEQELEQAFKLTENGTYRCVYCEAKKILN